MYGVTDRSNIADILYGSFIRYDRMYEMTKYAFYGKTDADHVNVFIDAYSILHGLFTRGLNFQVDDSCVIASCLINLAIHIRAYFETRHHVYSKVYIIYGGARPREAFVNFPQYNSKYILMEDSNLFLEELIRDNLNMMAVLCPYLYDIFSITDYENEFSVIASNIIDENNEAGTPNIIYSRDAMSYQLVAFKPYTFLYRPRKNLAVDNSWVVTKSTLYNAYRYGELNMQKRYDTFLSVELFSMLIAVSGLKSRSIVSLKTTNTAIKIMEQAISSNIMPNCYQSSMFFSNPNAFEVVFNTDKVPTWLATNRYAALDLPYQTTLYKGSPAALLVPQSIVNLYNPQEVRNINDKYFAKYPLDLNRV